MTPFVNDSDFQLYVGDVRDCLRELPAESVHTVVTSPPYWGLRDYGTGAWEGGNPDCDHLQTVGKVASASTLRSDGRAHTGPYEGEKATMTEYPFKGDCGKCGATRVDQQLGLEPTPDAFVAAMVDVFREVRRVLRGDGTLWLNLGDSYMAGQGGRQTAAGLMPLETKRTSGRATKRDDVDTGSWGERDVTEKVLVTRESGLKPKDLCGIPWRVAFALQADGWYLRSDIVWSKPNPMPESVTDRPTKSHEYVFLLSKSPRYFFDQEAVREALSPSTFERWGDDPYSRRDNGGEYTRTLHPHRGYGEHTMGANPAGRNVRSVWEIATQPTREAHFATFPEALPERCIKAGSSERGCCPECGAPWIRVTETMIDESRPPARRNIIDPQVTQSGQGTNAQGSKTWGHYLTHETKGWLPGCPCAAVDGQNICSERDGFPPVPCTVLDPFMGSGTTALVARRLGRRSIGVELNPEYAALCARRLQQLSLEFA